MSVAPARAEGVTQALVCRDAGGRTRLVAAAGAPARAMRSGTLILLLGRSIKPLTGQAFSLKRETVAPAGQVSFLGYGARLAATADALAAALPAWRSFSGLAFHGLIQ